MKTRPSAAALQSGSRATRKEVLDVLDVASKLKRTTFNQVHSLESPKGQEKRTNNLYLQS